MTSLTEQALDFSVKTASPSVKRMRMDSGSSTETTPACVSPQRTDQLNAQTTSTLAALGALMQQGNHHNNSSALLSQLMLNPSLFLLGNSGNFSPTPTPQPLSSLSADLAAAQLLTSLGSTGGSSTTSSVGSVGSGPAAAVGSDPNVTAMALTALQRRRRRAAQKGAATVDGGDLLSSTQSTPNKDPDGRESITVTPHKQRPMSATEDSGKDDTYWERRRKNNEAAKRSRDARRQKEEEVAARAAFLEQENLKLRAQVTILKNETAKLQLMLFSNVAQKHKQQQQQQDTMQTAADSSLSPPLSTDEQQIVKHDCAF